jgi:choline dehydrogenase-like flavoprotein
MTQLEHPYIVVGSGPAGVSCAKALLDRGHSVLMLDGGNRLEPENEAVRLRLESTQPSHWSPEDLAWLKQGVAQDANGIPMKLNYGSNFPYREAGIELPLQSDGVGLRQSYALGGLSNVWGGAILPFVPEDMADWPVAVSDLAPYYQAVLSFVDLAGTKDALSERVPLYCEHPQPLKAGAQVAALLADFNARRNDAARRGMWLGQARLALAGARCIYCGLCMYGCPYSLIYNAAETVQQMSRSAAFRYAGDVIVDRVVEQGSDTIVSGRSRTTGEALSWRTGRVFLGAGIVSTARIVLESMQAYDVGIEAKDSQLAVLPFLRWAGTANFDRDRNTLVEAVMIIADEKISKHSCHVEIHGYNEIYEDIVRSKAARFGISSRRMLRPILSRMLVFFCYLHSEDCGRIRMRLRSPKEGRTLLLQAVVNPGTRAKFNRMVGKLLRCCDLLKGLPVRPLMQVYELGREYHAGGTFPMSDAPKPMESDTLGRPTGFKRLHLIDGSTFPSIPATTITFTIMANAYRIGATFAGPAR